jgi:adenine-specific DNA methylase
MVTTTVHRPKNIGRIIENRESELTHAFRFTVKVGKPKNAEGSKLGTTAGKRAAFRCLMSGVPVTYDHIREEGKAGRIGSRLMAIVAEGERGRVYLPPTPYMEAVAGKAKPEWKPDVALPENPRDFKTPNYGLTTFADLFTPRQLVDCGDHPLARSAAARVPAFPHRTASKSSGTSTTRRTRKKQKRQTW